MLSQHVYDAVSWKPVPHQVAVSVTRLSSEAQPPDAVPWPHRFAAVALEKAMKLWAGSCGLRAVIRRSGLLLGLLGSGGICWKLLKLPPVILPATPEAPNRL